MLATKFCPVSLVSILPQSLLPDCLSHPLSLPLCKVASDFDRLNDQAAKHITHMRKAAEIVQHFKQELLKLTSRRVSSSVVVGGNQSAASSLETAQSLAQVYLCDLFVVLLTVLQIDVSVLPLHKFSPKFYWALLCEYIRIPFLFLLDSCTEVIVKALKMSFIDTEGPTCVYCTGGNGCVSLFGQCCSSHLFTARKGPHAISAGCHGSSTAIARRRSSEGTGPEQQGRCRD